MNVSDLYQQLILDHYKNPEGTGLRDPFASEVNHVNPTCGDEITLRVHLSADGLIEDVSYDAQGCSISVASTSMMHELVVGHSVDDAFARYEDFRIMMETRDGSEPDEDVLGDAVALAGVSKFPARVKCAMLGWAALRDALLQAGAKV